MSLTARRLINSSSSNRQLSLTCTCNSSDGSIGSSVEAMNQLSKLAIVGKANHGGTPDPNSGRSEEFVVAKLFESQTHRKLCGGRSRRPRLVEDGEWLCVSRLCIVQRPLGRQRAPKSIAGERPRTCGRGSEVGRRRRWKRENVTWMWEFFFNLGSYTAARLIEKGGISSPSANANTTWFL